MKQVSKRILSLSAIAVAIAVAPQVSAANWSDTSVGYRYGTQFTEPFNPEKVKKNILSLTHVSGYDYGQNFVNVDFLQSNNMDPANGDARGQGKGATEAYVTYRHQLHLGKAFDTDLSFGPVSDFGLTAGLDLNTKNTQFAPRKQLLVVGPTVKFAVPKGFLDFSILYGHERNHEATVNRATDVLESRDVTFEDHAIYNLTWGLPFEAGMVPMKFQGFANYVTPKGKGKTNEQLVRTSLMVDIGKLAFDADNKLWAGVGYEYWHNKFGNQKGTGTQTNAATFNLEYHF